MKIPNGSGDNFEWVDIEKYIVIMCEADTNHDILAITHLKGDSCSRFVRVSRVWSLEKLIMMCDLNGIKYEIVHCFSTMLSVVLKIDKQKVKLYKANNRTKIKLYNTNININ